MCVCAHMHMFVCEYIFMYVCVGGCVWGVVGVCSRYESVYGHTCTSLVTD